MPEQVQQHSIVCPASGDESLAVFSSPITKRTNYPYNLFSSSIFRLLRPQRYHCHNGCCNVRDGVSSREGGLCPLSARSSISAVVRGAGGRGAACSCHLCYKTEHISITAFLTSSESPRSEAVRLQRDSPSFLSLCSYFQNHRFSLAVVFSVCGLNFWARAACI